MRVRPATEKQPGAMGMRGKGTRGLKSLTHLALEGAALLRGKEKTALEAAGSTRARLHPARGELPRLAGARQGLPAGQGCATEALLGSG